MLRLTQLMGFGRKRSYAPVVPGSITYSVAGSNNFTIPEHNELIVELWGGGGGGSSATIRVTMSGSMITGMYASGNQGTSGGASTWNATTLVANGGTRAATYAEGANEVDRNGAGGAGGTGTGGDINTTGATGEAGNSVSNYGGKGGNGASGGAGGARATLVGTGELVGNAGSAPGGAGGGARAEYHAVKASGGGGGGGAYVKKTYAAGVYTPGAVIAAVVGAAGAGGVKTAGSYDANGGAGAVGRVKITWS